MSEVTLEKAAYGYAKDEYTEYFIYGKLSQGRFEKSQQFKKTLARLSEMEHRHYEFWRRYIPGKEIGVSRFRIYLMVLLRLLLGVTFAVKFLERNENRVVGEYESMARLIPAEDEKAFGQMVADEREHEQEFANQFNEPHIKYISFIVLGLADALVEIAVIAAK